MSEDGDTKIGENAPKSVVANFMICQINELKTDTFWRAVFAEFLGTFMLCSWTIGSGLHKGQESVDVLDLALTAGLFIGTIITVLQNVSGGNVNPAISIGLLVTRQISLVRFIFYVIAQTLGAIMAVFLVKGVFPPDMWGTLGLISPGTDVTDAQAFGCEFFMAFLLLFGTVAMIDSGRSDIQGSIPLFVGFIVVVNVLFGARVSGGCMNPARNFGPAVVSGNLEKQWIYWVGDLLGGAVGALLYDKLLSVKAMSSPLIGRCYKSRDKKASRDKHDINSSETEEMVDSAT